MTRFVTIVEITTALVTGAGLALTGSTHCALMCGPLSALTRGRGGRRGSVQYGIGRIVSYTSLGALAGSVGRVFYTLALAQWLELALSWTLGASVLLVALRELRPTKPESYVQLGRSPRSNLLGRLFAQLVDEPLLLGALTALLPCGMLYTAVVAAALLGSALTGALAMAVFSLLSGALLAGLAELPVAFGTARHGRRVLLGLMIAAAVVLFVRPLGVFAHPGQPACHAVSAGAQG